MASVYATKWKAFTNIDVDESEDNIKASAGKLGAIHAQNLSASTPAYLKVYNVPAATAIVGTTTPTYTYYLPPVDEQPNGVFLDFGDGVYSADGWCIAATTALAVADTGAPATNSVIVNGTYI